MLFIDDKLWKLLDHKIIVYELVVADEVASSKGAS